MPCSGLTEVPVVLLKAGLHPHQVGPDRADHFAAVLRHELEAFARINGRADIHDLSRSDLVTTCEDIAIHAGIEHA